MTITFGNDNDVIVYGLEKIISYARTKQHIILAQCVGWTALSIGLQEGLIPHIDNLRTHSEAYQVPSKVYPDNNHPDCVRQVGNDIYNEKDQDYCGNQDMSNSEDEQSNTPKHNLNDQVLKHCEEFLC